MANVITLKATERTEFGKGPARRLRAAGQVPAVVYGQGHDPKHIVLEGHESMLALRQENQLLSIEVEGQSPVLALPKEVQRDVMTGFLKHVDLLSITSGQKVGVQVALRVEGEPVPGTIVNTEFSEIDVEADAMSIPDALTISVEGLEAGTQILASQVELPAGATLVTEPETLVVNVTEQISAEALEAELAEAEAEAGIEQDEPETDETEGAPSDKQLAEGDAPMESPEDGNKDD